jgi:cytochrome c-type biogenesis protein CcmH
VLLALATSCSADKPAAAPPPVRETPPASAGGLRPLTSRDEAKPFATPNPSSSSELPAGHPPIGDAPAGKAVTGIVSISPQVAGRAAPTDVLYLIARSRATKAVVAVRRETDVRFPHTFTLSSADAMVADQPFAGPFDITARLSKSGDAIPVPGDLEGTAAAVAEGATKVALVIEKVRE